MYGDEVNHIPKDKEELWEILNDHFSYILEVLWHTPVESEEDALNHKYDLLPDGSINTHREMAVIRYRGGKPGYDNRDFFLEMGRDLLPYIHWALDEQFFTPEFVQQWGKIMFCHGYIAAHYFDGTDHLAHKRAGLATGKSRSKAAQRKWLAHLFTRCVDKGATRAQAEERISHFLVALLKKGAFPPGFPRSWFAAMVNDEWLVATYNEKHFSLKRMRVLVQEPIDDIPPIPEIP